MINNSKNTQITDTLQIAGLFPGDNTIEFIGVHEQFLSDDKAIVELNKLNCSIERMVEIYIYHLYGDVDHKPDFADGKLQLSENYRHSKNPSCLDWETKWIYIDGVSLTNRDLRIIDLIKEDAPDKRIASELGIAQSTFDFHKRNLYTKLNVQSKTELLIKVLTQHV